MRKGITCIIKINRNNKSFQLFQEQTALTAHMWITRPMSLG